VRDETKYHWPQAQVLFEDQRQRSAVKACRPGGGETP
jgi:hypothetical protein